MTIIEALENALARLRESEGDCTETDDLSLANLPPETQVPAGSGV